MSADQAKIDRYGNQLIECTVKKAAVEASLHAAQMLLLDAVATLADIRERDLEPIGNARALELFETQARRYLLTTPWVLSPDEERLASLSLAGAEGVPAEQGEGSAGTPNDKDAA